MNAGVTRSLSPNQSGIISGSPRPVMATRPIPLGSRFSMAARMGFIEGLYRGLQRDWQRSRRMAAPPANSISLTKKAQQPWWLAPGPPNPYKPRQLARVGG